MGKLKNGDILEIPLINGYGYAYAKFLNSKNVWEGKNIPDVLRVFTFRNITSVDTLNFDLLKDLLFAPVAISGSNGILKANWKIVGNEIITETDKFLPFVKSGWPQFLEKPEKWVYYEDLGDTTKMFFEDFNNIKHLEFSRVLDISVVPFKITLEFMKLDKRDIKETYKMNWLEEIEYKNSIDLPPYSSLPEKLQGRKDRIL